MQRVGLRIALMVGLSLAWANVAQAADTDDDGIEDQYERPGDTDQDGTPDVADPDDDGDGVPTMQEYFDLNDDGNPDDALDSDGDGTPNYLDADDDGDGIPTKDELGPGGYQAPRNSDGDLFPVTRLPRPDYLDDDDDGDGVPTLEEDVDGDGNPRDDDTDDDDKPDYLDTDDDGDGVLTRDEIDFWNGETDPRTFDTDGDGTPNYRDADDDGDGFLSKDEDRNESGDLYDDDEISEGEDGDGIPAYLDADDDDDTVLTKDELGPGGTANPRDSDGDGIFDYLDRDDDDDGVITKDERFPNPFADVDGDTIPDYLDDDADGSTAEPPPNPLLDADEDSVPNGLEDVNQNGNHLDDDTDGDGIPNYLDDDDDGDGVLTRYEYGSPTITVDHDRDGTQDYLDDDDDGDGLLTKQENPDPDGDGDPSDAQVSFPELEAGPDYLNPDDDGDGTLTKDERPNGKDVDADEDGRPDHLDPLDDRTVVDICEDPTGDIDGDGVPNEVEWGPRGCKKPRDTDRDGTPDYLDADDDGDGVPTTDEGSTDVDTDEDGVPDFLDDDDDGDGIPTKNEGLPNEDLDRDGKPNRLDDDADGDGIPDRDEATDSDDDGIPDFLEREDDDGGEPGADDDDGPSADGDDDTDGGDDGDGAGDDGLSSTPKRSGDGGCSVSATQSTNGGLAWLPLMLAVLLLGRRRSSVLLFATLALLGCGEEDTPRPPSGGPMLGGDAGNDPDAAQGADAGTPEGGSGPDGDGGESDSGGGGLAECELSDEALELAIDERGLRRPWDAIIVGNTVHLAYQVTTCPGVGQTQGLRYLSFGTTGAFGEPTDLFNMNVEPCRLTRSPALYASGDEVVAYFTASNSGRSELYRLATTQGATVEPLTSDPQDVDDIEELTAVARFGSAELLAYSNSVPVLQQPHRGQIVTARPGLSENIIVADTPIQHFSDLALAPLTTGGLLAWVADVSATPSISVAALDQAGVRRDDAVELSKYVGAESNVDIAVRDTGEAAIVYAVAPDEFHHELRFRSVSASGEVGPERKLTSGNRDALHVAVAPYADGYVVAYRLNAGSGRATPVIAVAFVAQNGEVAGERVLAEAAGAGTDPEIMVGLDGRIVVVFADLDGNGMRLRAIRGACAP